LPSKIRGSLTSNFITALPFWDLAIQNVAFALQNAVQPILFSASAIPGATKTAFAT
jgi:hypothetical protein